MKRKESIYKSNCLHWNDIQLFSARKIFPLKNIFYRIDCITKQTILKILGTNNSTNSWTRMKTYQEFSNNSKDKDIYLFTKFNSKWLFGHWVYNPF
jgi:hypothetical protein